MKKKKKRKVGRPKNEKPTMEVYKEIKEKRLDEVADKIQDIIREYEITYDEFDDICSGIDW